MAHLESDPKRSQFQNWEKVEFVFSLLLFFFWLSLKGELIYNNLKISQWLVRYSVSLYLLSHSVLVCRDLLKEEENVSQTCQDTILKSVSSCNIFYEFSLFPLDLKDRFWSCSVPKNTHKKLITVRTHLVKFGYSKKATKFEKIFHMKFDVSE